MVEALIGSIKLRQERLDEWMSFAFAAGLGDRMIPLFVISLGCR